MFKSLFSAIAKVLAIIAIIILLVVAIVLAIPSGGLSVVVVFGLSAGSLLLIGVALLGIAYVIDPDAASEVLGRAFQMVGDVLEGAATVIGDTVGAISSSLLSNPLVLLGLGLGGYYILNSNPQPNAVVINSKGEENADKS